MRIFLDDQRQEANFHLVARRAADEALVYTEPARSRWVGSAGGCLWGLALRRYSIPQFRITSPHCWCFFALWAVADTAAHQLGLLAVTLMGVWLTNMPGIHTRGLLDFKESLVTLLSLLSRGARITATTLTEVCDFEQFLAEGDSQRTLLVA